MRKWSIALLAVALLSGIYTTVNRAQEATGTIHGIAPISGCVYLEQG